MIRRAALGPALFVLLCLGAPLRSTAADVPAADQGLNARGTLVAQAAINGTKINIGGDIAMMTRGKHLRLDLLRLGVPGTDPAMSALITQFLPQGGLSFVLDQSTGSTMVWSDARRKYYVFTPAKAAPSPEPSETPGAPIGTSLVESLEMGKFFKDYAAFSESLQMRPRSTVNGHPATNIHIELTTQKKGSKSSTTIADVALAEDQQYLPVRISANVKPQNFSARIDFTSISPASPDLALFSVPAGYTAASDPSEVFGTMLPH